MTPTITPPPAGQDWEEILPDLDDAVAHLPERDRRAILLRYYQGLSHQEAAALLAISPAAAQRRLSRAVVKLRIRLQGLHSAILPAAFEHALQNQLVTTAPAHVVWAAIAVGAVAPSASASLIMKGAITMQRLYTLKLAGIAASLFTLTGIGVWFAVAAPAAPPATEPVAQLSQAAPPATAPTTLPAPQSAVQLIGQWTGSAHIIVNWTQARTLAVQLNIQADGRVSGKVGDASLKGGVLGTTHPFGLVFGVPESSHGQPPNSLAAEDHFQVTAALDGPLIAAEQVSRDGVIIVFDLKQDQTLQGGLTSTGSEFGGKYFMRLATRQMVLRRP
jgi:predicted DNA-binding protein (UPF0251 family)